MEELENNSEQVLTEAKPIVYWRVTSSGKRIKKILCPKGFKKAGKNCVPISGAEKAKKRVAIRKAVRSRKANPSAVRRAVRKRSKAMKRRKAQGLKPGQRLQ